MPRLGLLAFLGTAYVVWGTLQTISIKWADSLVAPDRFQQQTFNFAHPFVQALIMFGSESLCLLVFALVLVVKRYVLRQPIIPGKDVALPCNPTVWMLSAGADFGASILQNAGLVLTYVSVYQMLRGAVVIFVGLLSYIWLGRSFKRVEYVGMAFVTVGLTFVGLSSTFSHSSTGVNNANRDPLLGNLLIVGAQVLHAYQGVCEERLSMLYHIPPLQMVGSEGVYGVGMALMLLTLLQLVPLASFQHNIVDPVDDITKKATEELRVPYDDIILAFDQIWQNRSCLLSMLLYMLGGFFYNLCQVTIIKNFSATTTVMLGSLRNVTVWMVALAIPGIFEEQFAAMQLTGFCFLVAGNVLFQGVVPESWWRCWFPAMREPQLRQEVLERADDVTAVDDGSVTMASRTSILNHDMK